MNTPALWFDPLILGDLKAGAETMAEVDSSGELGVALVWFAAIPASQGDTAYTVAFEGLALDTENYGNCAFSARLTPASRLPDPAQAGLFRRDGADIQAVALALDPAFGPDAVMAARRVATALMARAAHETGHAQWSWRTPLGRTVSIDAWTGLAAAP